MNLEKLIDQLDSIQNDESKLLSQSVDKIVKSIDKSTSLAEIESCQTLINLFYQKYQDNNFNYFFNWKIQNQLVSIFQKHSAEDK